VLRVHAGELGANARRQRCGKLHAPGARRGVIDVYDDVFHNFAVQIASRDVIIVINLAPWSRIVSKTSNGRQPLNNCIA
jgi:hypothetical protein